MNQFQPRTGRFGNRSVPVRDAAVTHLSGAMVSPERTQGYVAGVAA